MKTNHHLLIWPSLAIITLDQLSKWVVVNTLLVHESYPVLNGFLNLVHVRNRGIAFGLMNDPSKGDGSYILALVSLFAVIIVVLWALKLREDERSIVLALSLIAGGAVGNLIDRVRFHEVIDFLDFHLGAYHWPAFNVADSAITVGTFWVAITLLFQKDRRKPSS